MLATDFQYLALQQQKVLLQKKGQYMYTRQEPKFFIDLFELDDLIVEVYYHHRTPEPVCIKTLLKRGNQSKSDTHPHL